MCSKVCSTRLVKEGQRVKILDQRWVTLGFESRSTAGFLPLVQSVGRDKAAVLDNQTKKLFTAVSYTSKGLACAISGLVSWANTLSKWTRGTEDLTCHPRIMGRHLYVSAAESQLTQDYKNSLDPT